MSEAIALSTAQMLGAWQRMSAGSPRYRAETTENVAFVFSGLPIGFFNVAIVTPDEISATELATAGRSALAWAADKGVPWMLIVTQEALAADVDATAVLDACGLAPVLSLTAMHAEQIAPCANIPEGLALEPALTDADCLAMIAINSAAYDMDLSAANDLLGNTAAWDGDVVVIGSVGDSPASATAVLQVDGYRYVAMVATHPDHQRKGYASATLQRALELAEQQHGALPTVLHATDAGRPVYERLGYHPIAQQIVFMDKALLGEH